jgi:preprotein translocase subunit SecG
MLRLGTIFVISLVVLSIMNNNHGNNDKHAYAGQTE